MSLIEAYGNKDSEIFLRVVLYIRLGERQNLRAFHSRMLPYLPFLLHCFERELWKLGVPCVSGYLERSSMPSSVAKSPSPSRT